jgi:nitrogen fixation/metabolism regulation signal transduction histidine kinase
MIRKQYYIGVLIRVLLILAASLVFAFSFLQEERLFTMTGAAVAIVLLSIDLVRLTNRFNRHLASFFEALKHEEHTLGLRKRMFVPGFPVLSEYMNDLNRQMSRVHVENEARAHFLNSIVEHIRVGMLAFDSDGKMVFFNRAAREILDMPSVGHLKSLSSKYPELGNLFEKMKPGDQKLVRLTLPGALKHLSVKAGYFISQQSRIHLFSFQDVEREVEETETETWKKLIRVLTHEINNSISPIYSLSDSLRRMVANRKDLPAPEDDSGEKMVEGLGIIQQRSQGLLDFVDKFRSLTPRGSLNPEEISLEELFYRVKILMQQDQSGLQRVRLTSSVHPATLTLHADKRLLEQVLINLLKNAIEAMDGRDNASIHLKAFSGAHRVMIQVEDNGPGIPLEEQERIFIPFFTTKKQGSGIGLSLSRQIMRMHGGSITVASQPHKGTTFTLSF